MKWMRRTFIVIGVVTLVHQYIWYQRIPKQPSALVAPKQMSVWAKDGGVAITDTSLLASIAIIHDQYGANQIQMNVHFGKGIWYAGMGPDQVPLENVVTRFPFLNYWLQFGQDDTSGLNQIARLIRMDELERQIVFGSPFSSVLEQLRTEAPHIPQIMPQDELNRLVFYRRWLLLPFFHTNYDVVLVPISSTAMRDALTQKFARLMNHLGLPVWVDEPENLSQFIWLEERHITSVRMTQVDLALMPRATLTNHLP